MELLKVLVSTLGRMVTHILVPLRTVKSKVKEFGGKLLKRTAISMRVVMWMIWSMVKVNLLGFRVATIRVDTKMTWKAGMVRWHGPIKASIGAIGNKVYRTA
jgi:hypothetical protein